MLDVQGLGIAYGAARVVQSLDISVGEGEVVALLGANGAGKTSTLRAISRLIPAEGSIVLEGRDLGRLMPDQVARLGLIHVPEGRRIIPTLTTHENLLIGLTARGDRTDVTYSVDDVYDLFPPLGALSQRDGWALSGGEQQMVAIGRALVASPRLLMLDEPSLGLAPVITKSLFATLAEIGRRTPILLVEQNTEMALGVCTRAVVLAEGAVVLQGTADELGGRQALLASILGQRDDRLATP